MTTLSDVSVAKTGIKTEAAPLWRPLLGCFALLAVVTGLIYPAATTVIGRALYPAQVEGSLIRLGDRVVGSALIGQRFVAPRYFWGRPSATAPGSHDASASAGANLGPTNPALEAAIKERIAALKAADPDNRRPIPVELVTTSASGLDPDISVAAAYYQMARIAKARGWQEAKVKATVDALIQGRQFGVLGEPRVNVLRLNLELDRLDGGAR